MRTRIHLSVISALALGLVGLLQADASANVVLPEKEDGGLHALVVVALPANANRAMVEALNRLRGEATSVGFEVRFVDASTDSMNLARLDRLSRGLRSAAVVAFADAKESAASAHSLDVWFLDRASGRTSLAHLTAEEVPDAVDRSDVVLAVRAVDFIRARMFDTLAGMQVQPVPPTPRSEVTSARRGYMAAGISVLGGVSGFSPALVPQIEVGYRWTEWGRAGVSAFGFGSQPSNEGKSGTVSLEPRFVGASLTAMGRTWRRLQAALHVNLGEFWLRVHGDAKSPNLGQTVTLSSPCASVAAGLMVNLLPYLVLDLRGGTLWLQSKARIGSTPDTYLGSLGRPAWFASARLGASF